MSLDIYFARDIANVLRATSFAAEGSAGLAIDLLADPEMRAALQATGLAQEKLLDVYRLGFRAALIAVGLGFGLVPECEAPKAKVSQVSAKQLEAALPVSWTES